MALQWMDGFESSNGGAKYPNSVLGTSGRAIGRLQDSFCLAMQGTQFTTPTLNAHATYTIGFAFQNFSLPSSFVTICSLNDGVTSQVDLRYNAGTGIFEITRAGTVLGTSSDTFIPKAWYYVEWQTTIDSSSGASQLKINQTSEINLTSQNTKTSSNSTANNVSFMKTGASSGQYYFIDDLYVNDGSGTTNTSFLGDVKIEAMRPVLPGTNSAWTPSVTGEPNYAMVAQNDSAYNSSSTVNAEDTFLFSHLRFTTTVIAAAVSVFAANQDSTTHSLTAVARVGGTDYANSNSQLVSSTAQQAKVYIYPTDPSTSTSTWSVSTVNASEFGYKLLS